MFLPFSGGKAVRVGFGGWVEVWGLRWRLEYGVGFRVQDLAVWGASFRDWGTRLKRAWIGVEGMLDKQRGQLGDRF